MKKSKKILIVVIVLIAGLIVTGCVLYFRKPKTNTVQNNYIESTVNDEQDIKSEQKPDDEKYTYIANANSLIFHYDSCPAIDQMKDYNKIYLDCTKEEAIRQGYKPCKRCME